MTVAGDAQDPGIGFGIHREERAGSPES